ncbi:MAG: adenine nucleotide alpha hydrolase family protein [Desulfurococcales archaeon]|nr:adenine nucleotide alpha hydrolase family protein [Desulfurococcales archaeon]
MAKCSICGKPAVVDLRYARRRFCAEHFIEFVERKIERSIKEYKMIGKRDRVIAAISGGKDSATLAGVLDRLRDRIGFELILLHIDLGISEYSRKSREASVQLAHKLGLELVIFDVKEMLGYSIPEMALRLRRRACSVCGIVKRYVMNAAGIELGADSVATGHNADDIGSYALKEFLFQNLENIGKLVPVSESIDNLAVRKIKPLYTVYEKESFLYSLLRELPYYHEECPHARLDSLDFTIKEFLNKLEEKFPSIKIQYVKMLARKGSNYPKIVEARSCRHCGLLSLGGECSFCRITRRLRKSPAGPMVRRYFSTLRNHS